MNNMTSQNPRESHRTPVPDPEPVAGYPATESPAAYAPESDSAPIAAPVPAEDDSRHRIHTAIDQVAHTRTRATYISWLIGVVILILLLIFIVANLETARINFLFAEVELPVGVIVLVAAIFGALITGLLGGARMFQLNQALKKAKKGANPDQPKKSRFSRR